ncbi:MAG: hypothetical protein KA174_07905 [Chitinophagales bacterium]|jgi:hypothetical protein|nr:hypothetical protein [Chitinophagales bacterium]
MKDILDKLTTYNIFNYLLPCTIFVYILKEFTGFDITQTDTLIGGFLYYFVGMIISRCGSVFIEPFLRWTKFVKFEEYKDYIKASKIDAKIELLSEVNNSYRTIISMLTLLLIAKGYKSLIDKFQINGEISMLIIVVLLFTLFIFSYRKQTNYITKRVKANI